VRRALALALTFGFVAQAAAAEPAVVASGAYPEGLLWHGGRMYFAEMGADRVSVIENGAAKEFWRQARCGPTSIAPFGPAGFLVNCHLGGEVVEVSSQGATGRRFRNAPDGILIRSPNASAGDGHGGVFFSDSGVFDLRAPATGRVYHLTAAGVITAVMGQLKYANGVNFDAATRTLYVSEHLARRVLSFMLDKRNRIAAHRVPVDFMQVPAAKSYSYPLAGPDGIALRPGLMAVAEYGEGRVHLFDRSGRHLNTVKVPMPFVDTVAWDDGGNLYAGGAFQNTRAPYEGAVVRFGPGGWQRSP
jgi:sugar lactone lactonase YvrE